ncbi:MAG TPA: cobalamin-dependent protein, partial [Magnetovibrio sp.]
MQVTIGQVQINNSFSGQNYLPYSVGCLESYARKNAANPNRYVFQPAIYKRTRIADAVEGLLDADVVGFSTYVWNARISLEIARRLKAQRPDIMIVFGGPHVPDRSEPFLLENPFIDALVHGEGERTFLNLLEDYPAKNFADIQGISYIDDTGAVVKTPAQERLRDLDELPSPFLSGVFDKLIESNPDETWIGLWETNRGCPFQCAYCDWGSATAAKVTKFGIDRLYEEVDWFSNNRIEFIFCCDANFGMLKRDVDLSEYVAKAKKETGYPTALSVQNTKNATEKAYLTQKILADSGLNKGVALSMQTVDQTTLKNIKRDNISQDSYFELQRRFTRDGIETYSDLILALPGETYETFIGGIDMLMETGQHNRMQFNNLSILPNTEMGQIEYQNKFGMVTVESEIINIHGERVELDDDVAEVQQLVVGTASMPEADWRRVRAYCWMSALLHFDKLFQIPLIVAHEVSGLSYRDMIEAFLTVDGSDYPLLAEIRDFFINEARSIQEGGPEYVYSKEWLGIYWPADEYIFIKLTAEKRFADFYKEAGERLVSLVLEKHSGVNLDPIAEALKLNGMLVKQPFENEDVSLDLNHNIIDFYMGVRRGEGVPLKQVATTVKIERSVKPYDDFQAW